MRTADEPTVADLSSASQLFDRSRQEGRLLVVHDVSAGHGVVMGMITGQPWRRVRLLASVLGSALGVSMSLGLVVVPAGATGGQGIDEPGPMVLPVPLARAGAYVGWGKGTDRGQWTLPEELDGVALREVVTSSRVTLALTADGRVMAWGTDTSSHTEEVPLEVSSMDVVDLAVSNTAAGVVGADGRVLVWGQSASWGDPTDVPRELTLPAAEGEPRVVQLALGQGNGFALRSDHTVVAWGNTGGDGFEFYDGLNQVPGGLRATQISAGGASVYALTTDGTVAGWGARASTPSYMLPAITQLPGKVRAVAVGSGMAAALLDDGSIAGWGYAPGRIPDLAGKEAVTIAAGAGDNATLALDVDGVLHADGASGVTVPESLEGETIAQFSLDSGLNAGVIVTRMLRAMPPTITGAAQAGSGVLTGMPGSFSAEPDEVSSQWLVNDEPVGDLVIGESTPGALPLAGYPVGTMIVYRSTATKASEETVTSTSAVVVLAAAPPPPVVKVTPMVTLKVTKKPTMRKAGKATITVAGGSLATSTVTLAATGKVKKGKKAKKKVFTVHGVLIHGTATVKIKKIKSPKGKWTLAATYAGDTNHNPAVSRPVKIKIRK